jgi:NADH-quinone oxidoreductase subunit J
MREYIFYFLALVTIITALMVVFSRNPIHSVLYLVVCFFSIAGHYLLLNAQFLAVVHIIIYAGAIMVLFLFVIMLLNLNKESEPNKPAIIKFASVISASILMLVLIAAMLKMDPIINTNGSIYASQEIGTVKNLGMVLFTDFLLPFEISSVLFLSAMVGVVLISKKES